MREWLSRELAALRGDESQSKPGLHQHPKPYAVDVGRVLKLLGRAEAFDKWMQLPDEGRNTRWKQYSMEGTLSALAAIDEAIRAGVTLHELRSVVLTLNHRSRLQGLMELTGVPPRSILRKFDGRSEFVNESLPTRVVGDLVFNYHVTDFQTSQLRMFLTALYYFLAC